MFIVYTDQENAFRAEVRDWFDHEMPAEYRHRNTPLPYDELKAWHKLLQTKGWATPHWPKEHGGMGASLHELIILTEEMGRVGAPHLNAPGLNFLAPALMAFGNDAQKATYLPQMHAGDLIWSQGYSEPNAGSDLASLRTRADDGGDHFIVNGQKIWGRHHQADWCFCLCRTDPQATPKHAGISLILIDLKSPGITVQGINTLTGEDEFGAVFFDDVKVPRENLVGPINGAWKIANHVLSFERLFTSNPQSALNQLDRAEKVAAFTGAIADQAFRDKLAQARIDVLNLQALYAHAVELTNGGVILGPDSSIMKIVGTEVQQAVMDVALQAIGAHAPLWDKVPTDDEPTDVSELWLQCRRLSIYGGANEIQRNIIAKRVLSLPTK